MEKTMMRNVETYQELMFAIQGHACVVKFEAAWCQPCKTMSQPFGLAASRNPNVLAIVVDIEQVREAGTSCGVRAVPTFQRWEHGTLTRERTGMLSPGELDELFA